jgi:hypothetical protein
MAESPRRRRRRLSVVVASFAAILALLGFASPAYADPETDDEGGTQNLREKLQTSAQAYYDLRAQLSESQKRQADITVKLRDAELSLARLSTDVAAVASARYKGSQLGILNGLFTGEGDPESLLQGAAVADYMVWRDDEHLRVYRETRDEAKKQRELLDAEVQIQNKALAELDKQKRDAEKALASVGGMVTAGYNGPVPEAQPAPRNANGSWPRETATIKDPTSGGKISPRMYHLLLEAQLAGFTHYTHCWRTQSWGEHPLGKACDFAAEKNGFGGAAAGADRTYGDRLASWGVKNAETLGIIYVIWYKKIWMPGAGWRTYDGCCDPSSSHTNHVHISML